jgi:hypothetical protein
LTRLRTPTLLAAVLLCALAAPSAAQDPKAAETGARADSAGARKPLRLCAGGDVTLGTNLDTAWVHTATARLGRRVPALPDPAGLVAPLRPLLEDADVVLLNVEGAIGEGRPGRRKCAPGSTACFAFRSPVSAAEALRGVAPGAEVIGNLANNHARDAGDSGLGATVRHLEAAGVAVTGRDTLATVVVTPEGDTVAFLGFSQWAGPSAQDLAAVRRHVRRAAARWDRVVVTVHMGAEGSRAVRTFDRTETFLGENRGNPVAFAHAAVDAGADVVFGHGPHVLRAAEWYGDGLIFYSLGNLLTYGPFSMGEPLNRGALACVDMDVDGMVLAAELRPTRQRPPGLVSTDSAARALELADRLAVQDFPVTGARVDADGAVLRPAEYAARRAADRPLAPAPSTPR